jgi:uncharacterized protein YndB with AHSA1/START domain
MTRQATEVAMEPEVVVERVLRAAPERVWRALTDPAELQRWFFTDCETDVRVGGSYRMWWRSAKEPAMDHERIGNYLEVVPGRRLVFEWKGGATGDKCLEGVASTVVTITLKPEGAGTRLRLVHAGWPGTPEGRESRKGHDRGWTFYFENLDGWLADGIDRRAAEFGQVVRPPRN